MTLTANQIALLSNLYFSQYTSGIGRDNVGVQIWRWDVVDGLGKSERSAGGIIMQAQKAGLATTDGVPGDEGCVTMTEAGFQALLAHYGINPDLADVDLDGWLRHHIQGADEPAVAIVRTEAVVAETGLGRLTKGGRAVIDSAVMAALEAAGAGCADETEALVAVWTSALRDDVAAALSDRQRVILTRQVRKGAKA